MTRLFWKAAAERAIKTFAQSLVAALSIGVGLLDAPWVAALSTAAMAAVMSILTSMASAGSGGGPSLTNAEVLPYFGKHEAGGDGWR